MSDQTLQPPEPEREPLPDVSTWAGMSDDDLEQRLRDSAPTGQVPPDAVARVAEAFRAKGMTQREILDATIRLRADAMTDDAEALAALLAPEPVHYNPGTLDLLSPCGLNLDEIAGEHQATDPARVTCPQCTASIVDSQLPPEPEANVFPPATAVLQHPDGSQEFGPRARVASDLTVEDIRGYRAAVGLPLAEPERRTVGLEVLTDELRQLYDVYGTRGVRVGIVCRVNGEVVDVPEIDAIWQAPSRKPADILSILLRQARMYADGLDGNAGAELLMPTPDVLAALAGKPVGLFTASVPARYSWVKPGWLVRTEVELPDGSRDAAWQLVEAAESCADDACVVAGGLDDACVVVTVQGRGVQHVETWRPVSVRIPASTEVEQP